MEQVRALGATWWLAGRTVPGVLEQMPYDRQRVGVLVRDGDVAQQQLPDKQGVRQLLPGPLFEQATSTTSPARNHETPVV